MRDKIAVFGLGYVGAVTAASLAGIGYRVTGVDRDEFKVRSIVEGRSPFYEPGLEELIGEVVAGGRLRASTVVAEALEEADVAMVCVGTPSARNGNQSLEQLHRVSKEIAQHVSGRRKALTVAVRSTVFPGTCEEVVIPALGNSSNVTVVAHPEFLRQGSALRDFTNPSLLVVGGSHRPSQERVAGLYASLSTAPCLVSLRTAEMIKYASNAFHALKITFANEIGAVCDRSGISGSEVMDTLCSDTTLNISSAYLKPGFAFGGSCLPKDVRALVYRAARLDLKLPVLESVLPSNAVQLHRATQAVLDLSAERIGIFGLAFKANTDDLRESPVVALVEQLIGKGRNVRIFDPHVGLQKIHGTNREYLLSAIPHIGKLVDTGLNDMLQWAQQLVVAQTPHQDYRDQIRRSGLPVLDLTGGGLSYRVAEPVQPTSNL